MRRQADRFSMVVSNLFGKRFIFASLTGKTAETAPF
jgi:hypothetical protein